MPNISDLIEQFLLETLGDDEKLILSRNELAAFFSCAPSQINYVLSTRFTPDRGYVIESRRGGGGSVTVVKLTRAPGDVYGELLNPEQVSGISYARAESIIDTMRAEGLIEEKEQKLLKAVLSDKALIAPTVVKDGLRANILKSALMSLLKEKE